MRITPIPCLSDNFAYLLLCEDTNQAALVDPSEPDPVLAAVRAAGVELVAILNTHHHWDHVGGNEGVLAKYPNIEVYGHVSDKGRIHGQTQYLDTGDTFRIGNLTVRAMHNPGHTTGAISYAVEDAVFTGDTMFAAGCGRIFEGTPQNMYESLCKVIGSLPQQTRVFFGHEYTEANLRFAAHVEPDNADVQARLAAVRKARAAGEWTTPSTLADEWRTNPFMRVDSPGIQASVKKAEPGNDLSPVSVLRVVRELKNNF